MEVIKDGEDLQNLNGFYPLSNTAIGIFFSMIVGLMGRLLHGYLPLGVSSTLGDSVIALMMGLLIGNFFPWSKKYSSGYKFCLDTFLKLAIILLGVKISLNQILSLGGTSFFFIMIIMAFALCLTHFLGKIIGLPPKVSTLIGIGTAVCGNTAISATAPAIGASDDEMSFAIATNTVFGTLAIILYPLIAQYFHLSNDFFGAWSGLAINDTSQVIGASFGYSEQSGHVATTIKLARNTLLGVAVVIASFIHPSKNEDGGARKGLFRFIRIPPFVILFMIVASINSIGVFEFIFKGHYKEVIAQASWFVKFLILISLAAVGLNTNFLGLKNIGIRPFLVGMIVAISSSLLAVGIIHIGFFI